MVERRNRIYTPEQVFTFVRENYKGDSKVRAEFDGDMIKPYSIRYKTFMEKGVVCTCCGLEGTRFYKERHQPYRKGKAKNYNPNEPYHLNLYGVKDDGEEVLFTRDHILARARGGTNHIGNMQTMCTECNVLKADMTEDEWANYDHTKSKEDNFKPYTYEEVLERANRYGKKVFVVTSLDNRYCVSTNLKNARKKYLKQNVISYEDFKKLTKDNK